MSSSADSTSHSAMEIDEDALLAAVKQYQQLRKSGTAPPIDQYVAKYPQIANVLRQALEGLAMFQASANQAPGTQPACDRSVDAKSVLPGDFTDQLPPGVQVQEREFLGKPIGDFQIVNELGRGGMGVVYEAIQLSLNRRVALKVLPLASGLDKVRLQRFRNEAHAAAQLHHTNIVPVYAVGSERGIHYYAMQLIEGQTLAELILQLKNNRKTDRGSRKPETSQKSPLSRSNQPNPVKPLTSRTPDGNEGADSLNPAESLAARSSRYSSATMRLLDDTFRDSSRGSSSQIAYFETVVEMIVQAALALDHAHQYGVIHRDVKPGNLLLDQAGKVWVTDFGLAQIQHIDANLTRSGDHIGTLRYMSPEQATGERDTLDHRSDIYSLGVTLYELLTLQPTIVGENYREMLNQLVEQEPRAPRAINPAIPIDLETIVQKAIAKEPTQRYSSAQALANDLICWQQNKPIAARPPTMLTRLAKWRKRNSLLVNMASVLMVLAMIGLVATTLVVLNQQQQTQTALQREIEQRNQAELSFKQARAAVDTFSELSENELAFRPEVQNLRKKILQISLDFYRGFLAQRRDDALLSQELKSVSDRVERILGQLKLIQKSRMYFLLNDSRVIRDLEISDSDATQLIQVIARFQSQQDELEASADLQYASNETAALQVKEFVELMDSQLSEQRQIRLQQISWQLDLPFTFLSEEIVDKLEISALQRQQIGRIIEEHHPEAPGRLDPRRDGPRDNRGLADRGPPRDFRGGPGVGGPDGRREFRGFGGPGGAGSGSGPGPGIRGPEFGPDRGFQDSRISQIRRETVDQIVRDVLTEPQKAMWRSTIGPTFQLRPPIR